MIPQLFNLKSSIFNLQKLGQLEEFVAVAALDENVIALRTFFLNSSLYLLHIVEFPESTGDIEEIVAYEPHFIIARRFQIVNQ